MALEILVEIAELAAAANELNQASQIYEEAVEAAKSAAAELASKWEGESKEAFVVHQENAYSWHKQILSVVRQMVEVILKAVDTYEEVRQTLVNIAKG